MGKPDAVVALMEPYYTYHVLEVERVFSRKPVVIPSIGDKAEYNFDELHRRVTAGEVHGVIVTNPGNPNGCVLTPAEVVRLYDLANKHGCFVMMDECYVDMVFNGKTHVSPIHHGLLDNIVVCRGFSKCVGCQSWRVGYAISTPVTLLEMMRQLDPLYVCTNWCQHAIAHYFENDADDFPRHVKELNKLLQANWRMLSSAFQKRFGWEPLEPNGTMYGLFRHRETSDLEACEMALRAGVGICPGTIFFGDPGKTPPCTGWVRIHVGIAREKAELVVQLLSSASDARV